MLLLSCKARQIITLRCRSTYVYIIIYPSQSTRDPSIVQLLPLLHWRLKQLRALLQGNSSESARINTLMFWCFNAGILNCTVGATWFLPVSHFCLTSFYTLVAGTPFTALSEGGIQVHPSGFTLGRVQISGQLRSRHILYIVKTKDLYSPYCPKCTGGCIKHPPCYATQRL